MNIALLIFLTFFTLTIGKPENDAPKPNIVVIMADDLGFDDVSFHGARQHITPNIDALAYHGVILNNLYAPPMCTPSRAAFMTGKYPIRTGTQHYVISNETPWGMDLNSTTIGEIFRDAGYVTRLIGKWHLGMAHQAMLPTKRGFDSHYGYLGGYVGYYDRRSKMPVNSTSPGYDFRRDLNVECSDEGQYLTDLFTKEAEEIIKSHNNTKPLFLVVNHLAPHTGNEDNPLQAPKKVIEKFKHIKDEKRRVFAAMVSKLDESVGNITRALHNKRILNNTILIFYSDNGAPTVGLFSNTGSNWPMRGQKNTPWEGGVRVAGAIWSPLLNNKRTIFKQNMYVGDWLPTLARAANIKLNPNLQLDGLDIWEELSYAGPETFDRDIVHVLDDIWNVTSYLSGNFKYINGTTLNGFASDVMASRDVKEIDPRNRKYNDWVLKSTSGRVLAKYDRIPLTARRIKSLRSAAQIKCGQSRKRINCNPLVEECLYRIDVDPCERNNLARLPKYQKMLEEMRKSVRRLRLEAVPPAVVPGVPEGDPSLHDCTWTWFMDEAVSNNIQNCSFSGTPCQAHLGLV